MILIDDRSGSKDLYSPTLYPQLHSLSSLTQINNSAGKPVGDICFEGSGPNHATYTIGIEIKSLGVCDGVLGKSDMLSSIQSGRLQGVDGQLDRMHAEFDVVWVLTYGTYRESFYPPMNTNILEYPDPRTRQWKPFTFGNPSSQRYIPSSYLHKFIFSISRPPLSILYHHAHTKSNAASWIIDLYHWWQKPYESHRCMRTFNTSMDSLPLIDPSIPSHILQLARFAAQYPGVRFERAMSIAKHFNGSVEDFFNPGICTVEELCRIPGIGKTIAKSIVSVRSTRCF
jgi:hypothetical protein